MRPSNDTNVPDTHLSPSFSLSLSLASTAIAIFFALLRSQWRNFGPGFCFFNFVRYVELRSTTGGMRQISQIWLQIRLESLKNSESLLVLPTNEEEEESRERESGISQATL
jgi:hypothetical protein